MSAVDLLADTNGNALAGADGSALGQGCPAPCCGPPAADCSTGQFCAAFPGAPYQPAPVNVWPDPAVRNCCYGANHRLTVAEFVSEWRVDRLAGGPAVDVGFESRRCVLSRPTSIVISAPQCDPKFWPHDNGGAEFGLEWSGSRVGGGCPPFSLSSLVVARFAMYPNTPALMPESGGGRTGRVSGNPGGGGASWCPVPAWNNGGVWQAAGPWARDSVAVLWSGAFVGPGCTQAGNLAEEVGYAGQRDSGVASFAQGAGAFLRAYRVVSTNAWGVVCGGVFAYDLLAEVEVRNGVGTLLKTITERVRCSGSVVML